MARKSTKSKATPSLPSTISAPMGAPSGEPKVSRSVVPKKWRDAHKATGSCGDDTAVKLSKLVQTTGDDGTTITDRSKLKKFAMAHGLWQDKYDNLNVGMVRMNVSNRLRAAMRRPDFKVNWK